MYSQPGNYSIEFFTPPYDFLAAAGSHYQPVPRLRSNGGLVRKQSYTPALTLTHEQWKNRDRGMGACCSSCAHGGACSGASHGVGLFDSGLDYEGWGMAEWAIAGLGTYALFSMFSTTKRGVEKVSRGAQRVRRAARVLKGA